METTQALELLTSLANGTHPFTGASFPADSPYQHPDLVRALFLAVRTLEATRNPAVRRGQQRAQRTSAFAQPTSAFAQPTSSSSGAMDRSILHAPPDTAASTADASPLTPASPASAAAAAPVSASASASGPARGGRGGKSGKNWSLEEDAALLTAYDAGQTVAALALAHERSRLAIEARLARYQRVPMPSGLRSPRSTHPVGQLPVALIAPIGGSGQPIDPATSDAAQAETAHDTPNGEAGPTSAAASPAIPATIPMDIPAIPGAGLAVREPPSPLAASFAAYLPRPDTTRQPRRCD